MSLAKVINEQRDEWLVVNALLSTARRYADIADEATNAPPWIRDQLYADAKTARRLAERIEEDLKR